MRRFLLLLPVSATSSGDAFVHHDSSEGQDPEKVLESGSSASTEYASALSDQISDLPTLSTNTTVGDLLGTSSDVFADYASAEWTVSSSNSTITSLETFAWLDSGLLVEASDDAAVSSYQGDIAIITESLAESLPPSTIPSIVNPLLRNEVLPEIAVDQSMSSTADVIDTLSEGSLAAPNPTQTETKATDPVSSPIKSPPESEVPEDVTLQMAGLNTPSESSAHEGSDSSIDEIVSSTPGDSIKITESSPELLNPILTASEDAELVNSSLIDPEVSGTMSSSLGASVAQVPSDLLTPIDNEVDKVASILEEESAKSNFLPDLMGSLLRTMAHSDNMIEVAEAVTISATLTHNTHKDKSASALIELQETILENNADSSTFDPAVTSPEVELAKEVLENDKQQLLEEQTRDPGTIGRFCSSLLQMLGMARPITQQRTRKTSQSQSVNTAESVLIHFLFHELRLDILKALTALSGADLAFKLRTTPIPEVIGYINVGVLSPLNDAFIVYDAHTSKAGDSIIRVLKSILDLTELRASVAALKAFTMSVPRDMSKWDALYKINTVHLGRAAQNLQTMMNSGITGNTLSLCGL